MLGLGVHGKLVAQPRNGLAVDQYSSAAGNDRGRGKAFCGVVLISEFSKLGAELKTPDSNRQALADQFPGLLVA